MGELTRVACISMALLAGCAAMRSTACPAHGTSTPAVSEAQLRAAWEARFGKLPSPACDAHWTWNVMSQSDFVQVCGSNANACTIYPAGCPLSATNSTYALSRELNTHEYAHWALFCSTGDSDHNHTNVAVWGPDGFDGSFGS